MDLKGANQHFKYANSIDYYWSIPSFSTKVSYSLSITSPVFKNAIVDKASKSVSALHFKGATWKRGRSFYLLLPCVPLNVHHPSTAGYDQLLRTTYAPPLTFCLPQPLMFASSFRVPSGHWVTFNLHKHT